MPSRAEQIDMLSNAIDQMVDIARASAAGLLRRQDASPEEILEFDSWHEPALEQWKRAKLAELSLEFLGAMLMPGSERVQ